MCSLITCIKNIIIEKEGMEHSQADLEEFFVGSSNTDDIRTKLREIAEVQGYPTTLNGDLIARQLGNPSITSIDSLLSAVGFQYPNPPIITKINALVGVGATPTVDTTNDSQNLYAQGQASEVEYYNAALRNADRYVTTLNTVKWVLEEKPQLDVSTSLTKDLETAKQRTYQIQHPDDRASYYDLKVPFNRPISTPMMISLMFVATFLVILSIALFLSIAHVEFDIKLPGGDGGTGTGFLSRITESIGSVNYMYGAVAGVTLGVVGAFLYQKYLA